MADFDPSEYPRVDRVLTWWQINMREPMTMAHRSAVEVVILKWLRAGYSIDDLKAVWASQGGLVWRAKILELLVQDEHGKFPIFAGMLSRCRPRTYAPAPTGPKLDEAARARVSKLLADTKAKLAAGEPLDAPSND